MAVEGLTLDLSGASLDAAQAVCEALGIEHHVVDAKDDFERCVVASFVDDYARGRTPNPCVVCNPLLKFSHLERWADRLACDLMVTGHYARVWRSAEDVALLKGIDVRKDQSYMLHRLGPSVLERLELPLGGMTKPEVVALATEAELPSVGRPESQDACFIPDGDVAGFVTARHPEAGRPGPIVDRKGTAMGEHLGLAAYTVGQRKGLGLGGPEGPFFVLEIDAVKNTLVVGPEEALWVNQCYVEDLVVRGVSSPEHFSADVVTRLRGLETPAEVTVEGDLAKLEFARAHRAPTPGQAAVLYDDDRVLGGGTIISPKEAKQRRRASKKSRAAGEQLD